MIMILKDYFDQKIKDFNDLIFLEDYL
jgi:hypothetical protein